MTSALAFLPFVILSTAAAQNTQPPIEKSAYHLFNPTPRALWRPMSADRPDSTESPYTVDAGAVQIELSFVEYAFRREHGRTRTSRSIAPINLKLGLTNTIDLQLLLNPYENETGGGEDDLDGIGDTGLRLKVNLLGNDDGDRALALLPFISFPTGSDEVSADAIEGGVAIPFAMALPFEFSLGLQIQLEFVDGDDHDRDTVFSHTAVIGHGIIGGLAAYLEYIGEVTLDGDDGYSPSLSCGLTYAISDNAQLDIGVVIGLDSSESDDLRLFSGLTMRF